MLTFYFSLFTFHLKKPQPYWWQNYIKRISKLDKNTPIEDINFIVFDTETTGLNPATDSLLSLGAVRVVHSKIETQNTFELHFNDPKKNSSKQSITIHGLLNNSGDTAIETGVIQFLDFIGNAVLVGHHVAFDVAFINQTLKKLTGKTLQNKTIDTAQLYQRVEILDGAYYHGAPHKSLDELCTLNHIDMHDRHTAAGDALLTSILFLKLIAKLKNQNISTLGDLINHKLRFTNYGF